MQKPRKIRVDQAMLEQGIATSIERAQALIMAGEISVAGNRINSGAELIEKDQEVLKREESRFVSRGGIKLDFALSKFEIDVTGKVCADVGAATGGFSDAFLQRGALKVFAVDVGYGDLHWKVRSNERVVPIERTNARYLEKLPEQVSLIAVDVSFISVTQLLANFKNWLSSDGEIVVLVKPQFEAEKDQVGEGGIITDPEVHRSVLHRVIDSCNQQGFSVKGLIKSPIQGTYGNVEFLLYLAINPQSNQLDLTAMIDQVIK
jgi:23S rRNA (cytidine1920-2'-O)/16S rRNA (cytidine1409-2'-O)-methyltransferase